MIKNPHFRSLALAAAMLFASVPVLPIASPCANGAPGLTVSVPDVFILDYFNNIDLGLAGRSVFHEPLPGNRPGLDDIGQAAGGTGEPVMNTLKVINTGALRETDLILTLRNVWAVRGFSNSGKASVGITGDTALKTASGASSIGISKLQLRLDDGSASTAGGFVNADLKGIRKLNSTKGDVVMGLNLINATAAPGDYTGTITITAVTL